MKITVRTRRYFLLLLAAILIASQGFAQQASSETQRYNRIQYRKFKWQVFHAADFHIYFPKGDDSLCAFISKNVTEATERVKQRMGTTLKSVPNIIIYPSPDQLYESNIGAGTIQDYTLPTFVSKGSRLLLAFNGSYEDLKNQLYEAIARSVWEGQLQSDLTSQLKSKPSGEEVPNWFKEGAIHYFSEGWTIEQEARLERLFVQDSIKYFGGLVGKNQMLAGTAFCYYLSQRFRQNAVQQVFFQMKKNKSLPRALRLITKRSDDSLYNGCFNYYKERFNQVETPVKDTAKADKEQVQARSWKLPIAHHGKGRLERWLLSPDGTAMGYIIANTKHQRIVYVYDARSKQNRKLTTYQLPPWLKDHAADCYPLLSWNNQSNELLITYPIKGKLTIASYSITGSLLEKTTIKKIDGAGTLTPLDRNNYLLAAWLKGQSDLVIYAAGQDKITPLTNDIFDDREPAAKGEGSAIGSAIYFVSARKKDTTKKSDSFALEKGIYKFQNKHTTAVITDTQSFVHWYYPTVIGNDRLLSVTTRNGKEQIVLLDTKSGENDAKNKPKIIADYQPFQYLESNDEIVFADRKKDSLVVIAQPINAWLDQPEINSKDQSKVSPWLKDVAGRMAAQRKEDSTLKAAKINGGVGFMDGVFKSMAAKDSVHKKLDSLHDANTYSADKAKTYLLQLYSAYFTAQVNNDFFMNRYQPYLNSLGTFKVPEVGGMIQGGVTDLFENKHLTIAYRLPAGTAGSNFFVHYENTSRRLDWGVSYYRSVSTLQPDTNSLWTNNQGQFYPTAAKLKTHYYEVSLHYPFTYFASVDFTTSVRKDKTIFLATDNYSLGFPSIPSTGSVSTLSYSNNHLVTTLPNLYRGWKIKLTGDGFKGFTDAKPTLGALGLYAAWHKPLYRYITFVAQLHSAISGGKEKILYNLGGVDNNLSPRVDTSVHFAQTAPYAFQTLVTPFRGYQQNSLYGNRFALLNTDVYCPIFQTIVPIKTGFSSINNLHLGLFSDVGTAKETFTPNAVASWKWSYGFSARTLLAGYPLRFDMGWPGSFKQSPVWYLSLNLL